MRMNSGVGVLASRSCISFVLLSPGPAHSGALYIHLVNERGNCLGFAKLRDSCHFSRTLLSCPQLSQKRSERKTRDAAFGHASRCHNGCSGVGDPAAAALLSDVPNNEDCTAQEEGQACCSSRAIMH